MEDSMSNVPAVSAGALSVITAAEIDVQVATAHKFPRHTTPQQLAEVRRQVLALAKTNEEVAADCFYAVPRDGKTISGPSIRFAEILASRWGNCRVGARVVAEERDHIVAEGVFHDLETNHAWKKESKRRITKRDGTRYNADMLVTTGNAAGSIAARGAVLAAIPEAFWQDILGEVKRFIIGDASTLADKRAKMLGAMQKLGATEAMVLRALDRVTVAEITGEDIVTMRAVFNSIRDGEKTVDQVFTAAPAAAAPQAASGAPAESKVEEAEGYAPEPTEEEKAAHKKKIADMRKKVAEKEAAAKKPAKLVEQEVGDDPDDFERDDAAATEQAAAEKAGPGQIAATDKPLSKAQQIAKNAAAKLPKKNGNGPSVAPNKILIAIGDDTKVHVTEIDPIPAKPGKGDLLWEGAAFPCQQWDGERWLEFADQQIARDQVITDLRRRSTKWFRSQRLDREAAMKNVAEALSLPDAPTSMSEMPIEQLVAFVQQLPAD